MERLPNGTFPFLSISESQRFSFSKHLPTGPHLPTAYAIRHSPSTIARTACPHLPTGHHLPIASALRHSPFISHQSSAIIHKVKPHPRVLLLCSMNQSTANGITIANLFKGWPHARIALAEVNGCFENSRVDHITRYYIFGRGETRFLWPFNYLRRPQPSQVHDTQMELEDKVTGTATRIEETGKIKKLIKGHLLGMQRWFLNRTGLVLVSRRYRISPEFEHWVREFDPDIIYCVSADLCKLKFFARMLDYFECKGCVHIFDDYLAARHEGTLFPNYWKRRLNHAFREVCRKCDLHLAIGDKMAVEYTERYGYPFYGFHNPLDPEIWLRAERQPSLKSLGASGGGRTARGTGLRMEGRGQKKSSTGEGCVLENSSSRWEDGAEAISHLRRSRPGFSFLYAGKINRDTLDPIRRFMQAVENLRQQGHSISFKIHSPYPFEGIRRLLGDGAERVYGGKLPYADLPNAYRQADGLLLPLGFTAATIRYIRLSMLTKVSEYMISGTPILCFAPGNIAVSEYLLAHDAAVLCSDPENLESAILAFIENRTLRQRVANNAMNLAESHHMMDRVNEKLARLLSETSAKQKA